MASEQQSSSFDEIDAFTLLSGQYEANRLPEDLRERSVPDYGYNILNQKNKLYHPILDNVNSQIEPRQVTWPNDSEFAVCLTHDLDHITLYSVNQVYRRTKQKLATHWRTRTFDADSAVDSSFSDVLKSLAIEGRSLLQSLGHTGNDPLHNLERWLDLEQSIDAKSTFFVLPTPSPPYHISDPEYRFTDEIVFEGTTQTVAEMLREINNRGFEIGLHPTWYTFNDADALRQEKSELERIIQDDVESVRHHFLHYDIRCTPRIQELAGLKYDSTLGFNRNIGFRFGTSYPWTLYDLNRGKQTNVVEIPLNIQDTALFRPKGLGVDADIAFEYVKEITRQVKKVGGVLTLSWHPSKIIREGWWSLYERILEYLDQQNVWFATIREIGEYWRERSSEAWCS